MIILIFRETKVNTLVIYMKYLADVLLDFLIFIYSTAQPDEPTTNGDSTPTDVQLNCARLNCAIDLASGPIKDKIIINTCPSHVPKIIPLGI